MSKPMIFDRAALSVAAMIGYSDSICFFPLYEATLLYGLLWSMLQ